MGPHRNHRNHRKRWLGLSASLLAGRSLRFPLLISGPRQPGPFAAKPWLVSRKRLVLPLYWRQCNSSILTEKIAQLSREPTPDLKLDSTLLGAGPKLHNLKIWRS